MNQRYSKCSAGDNCTLIVLKRAVEEWLAARNAPVTGMFGIAERDALIKAEYELERALSALNADGA